MILDILEHTPFWVWIILALLIASGLRQARARELTRARVTILPLVFIALSLSGVLRQPASLPLVVGAWALGFAAVLLFARNLVAVRGASWSPRSDRFRVPGSWLPLFLMVGLFIIKYGVAVALAMHPALTTDVPFAVGCNLVFGLFGGVFWTRAQSLRTLTQAGAAAQSA